MLNSTQLERMIKKQQKYIDRMEKYIFKQVEILDVVGYLTKEKLTTAPENVEYKPYKTGDAWGGQKTYCWFKSSFTVPEYLDGQRLYLSPECSLYEGLLFVNDLPYANYASKFKMNTGHGNHYCKVFSQKAKAGEVYDLVLEAYTGNDIEGCMPYEEPTRRNYDLKFDNFKVMVQDELVKDFYYNFKILMELYNASKENTAKKAEIELVLFELNKIIYFSNEETDADLQRDAMEKAIAVMQGVLSKKNSCTAAKVGIVGHSHMDTAWLWEIDETIKKCARTFGNQLNMMDQFPNYHFMQSSAAHLRFMEIHYPKLFEEIKKRVAQGKYEPNGGVWIECDCNITGGEFMVRQFLWGQRYTMKNFGYKSNSFFLPDTFGYSAAIPQILKGVDIDYFLTTKMDWNDTNKFPYTSFYWQGIDGTKVLAHNNITHRYPTPEAVTKLTDEITQKSVSNQRLLAYGFGDGGGGPEDSSAEIALRIADLEGCPQVYDTTVAEFMVDLEENITNPNTHVGELYLELHRGTLTNQHTIKRNNRKSEIAIRNAEYFTALNAMENDKIASSEKTSPLVETLLVNQFHDILPGTCVPEVHDRSIKETTEIIKTATNIVNDILENNDSDKITIYNTLSNKRDDVFEVKTDKYLDLNCKQQFVEKLNGEKVLHISGIELDGFSSITANTTCENKESKANFSFENNILTTPFAKVTFAQNGSISSFIDLRNNRELKGSGHNLNTFLFGEDLSLMWDNWDIDADCVMNLEPSVKLDSLEVVSSGAVEFRMRANYTVSKHTSMKQDMVFYADSPRVDFESAIDWNDKHRLLKTMFDTSINTDYATQEIQYGNVRRTAKRNNTYEQAQFEVCNHKYSDLSEPAYGISLLNDCKYGISVLGSAMALTLHKGGCKPDPRGDRGVHEFTYSFYPHMDGFKAETVTANAYMINHPAISAKSEVAIPSLLKLDKANVIVESVKACEDNEKALIVRIYEAEGSYTNVNVEYNEKVKAVTETNMLEIAKESQADFKAITFKPYEIKTFKISY